MNNQKPSGTQIQLPLDLGVELEKNVNGIEMGILENGIAYLTQSGLGAICGSTHSRISEITKEWEQHFDDEIITKDRIGFIKTYLHSNGFDEPKLYIHCRKDNRDVLAYPEIVCMAILEFYAFESRIKNDVAKDNYRKFARFGLQQFIYKALDYSPDNKWKYHLDRISILKNATPAGYFTVFQEIGGMVVDLIDGGLTVNDKTIPDISVGISWGKYWKNSNLEATHGVRIDYPHEYPEYYPQSYSNPQPAKAYPESALGEFRRWFREEYLTTKFPKYILTKAKILTGGKEEAQKMIEVFKDKGKEQAKLSAFNEILKTAIEYDPKK